MWGVSWDPCRASTQRKVQNPPLVWRRWGETECSPWPKESHCKPWRQDQQVSTHIPTRTEGGCAVNSAFFFFFPLNFLMRIMFSFLQDRGCDAVQMAELLTSLLKPLDDAPESSWLWARGKITASAAKSLFKLLLSRAHTCVRGASCQADGLELQN